MAILKRADGLIQLDKCPICEYLVEWTDMQYENQRIIKCRFCPSKRMTEKEIKRKDFLLYIKIWIFGGERHWLKGGEFVPSLSKRIYNKYLWPVFNRRKSHKTTITIGRKKMKTEEEILAELAEIDTHVAMHSDIASITDNPALGLMQIDLKARKTALRWILGEGNSIKTEYGDAWVENKSNT